MLDRMGVKDLMHLVLDPAPMPHDLVAPRDPPAHSLSGGIGFHISGRQLAAYKLASVPASIL